jgi:trehalose 6-phosphate synthase
MSRVVTVSNRVLSSAHHGVVSGLGNALRHALRGQDALWFGWDGVVSNEAAAPARLYQDDAIHYASFSLLPDEYRHYYAGFCNSTLWPWLHALSDQSDAQARDYWAYRAANRRFARLLRPLLRHDDIIWIHDYHLLPLAQELRHLGIRARIGFFLHTSFAIPESLHRQPILTDLLSTMRHYDLIGFQTRQDQDALAQLLARIPGRVSGPETLVCPVSVDANALQLQVRRSRAHANTVVTPLMLGIDRLDPAKGLHQRLTGFESFMASSADARHRLRYRQIAAPTRVDLPDYQALSNALRNRAADIQARYADSARTPIEWLEHFVPHAEALNQLAAAAIACVTPLRDGLNLVAKEFVAVQDHADPGILILARTAGAAQELTSALLVDAGEPESIAAAIVQALSMPLAERRARHSQLWSALQRHTLSDWYQGLVAALGSSGAQPMRLSTRAAWLDRKTPFQSSRIRR